MSHGSDKPRRASFRLPGYDYTQPGAYFVTICTQNQASLFGEVVEGEMRLNVYGQIVHDEWAKTADIRQNVQLDSYMVMPNHFHAIIILADVAATTHADVAATRRVAPTGPKPGSIGAIIGQFKSVVAKRINEARLASGTRVWQRNYFEHVIRSEDELDAIRKYIAENPMRWEFDRENPGRRHHAVALQLGKTDAPKDEIERIFGGIRP